MEEGGLRGGGPEEAAEEEAGGGLCGGPGRPGGLGFFIARELERISEVEIG